jgi:hypothetical protein
MMYALSVRQPWAWLVVNDLKDIENRGHKTRMRGEVAIHAPLTIDWSAWGDMINGRHPARPSLTLPTMAVPTKAELRTGGIIGVVTFCDCVTAHDSAWFVGPYGYVLKDARPVPFVPCRGQLGFFKLPADIEQSVRAAPPVRST